MRVKEIYCAVQSFLRRAGTDLLQAWRNLKRDKRFSVLAVLTIGLGVGAAASVFTLADTVLYRPLPYSNPERLVQLWALTALGEKVLCSSEDWLTIKAGGGPFQSIALVRDGAFFLSGRGPAARVGAQAVSEDYFEVLGAKAFLGRTFQADDRREASDRIVVVSFHLWKSLLGGKWDFESPLWLDGAKHVVVGVMPENFRAGRYGFHSRDTDEVWVLSQFEQAGKHPRSRDLTIIARLQEGVSVRQANAQLRARRPQAGNREIRNGEPMALSAEPLRKAMFGDKGGSIRALFAGSLLLLLLCFLNVSALSAARALSQVRELAIRIAIGATPMRLIRQMAGEILIIAAMGAVASLCIIQALGGLVRRTEALDLPRLFEYQISWRVFIFGVFVCAAGAAIAVILPSVQLWGMNVSEGLKVRPTSWLRGVLSPLRSSRYLGLLPVVEIALSVSLLIAAGLVTKTVLRLAALDLGFNPRDVLCVKANLQPLLTARGAGAAADLCSSLAALPGVQRCAVASSFPLLGMVARQDLVIRARGVELFADSVQTQVVGPEYFPALSIPVLRGRDFEGLPPQRASHVAVVSNLFAKRYLGRTDPIGALVRSRSEDDDRWLEIIGVVGDVRDGDLDTDPAPELYLPQSRQSDYLDAIVLKTSGRQPELPVAVRNTIFSANHDIAVESVIPLRAHVARLLAPRRAAAGAMVFFALLAILLANVGVFGLMTIRVREKTQDFAIHIAIGASRRKIVGLALKGGLTVAVQGVLIGLAIGYLTSRSIGSLIYGVEPADLWTYIYASVFAALAALAASYIPAHRASRIDPISVLRSA